MSRGDSGAACLSAPRVADAWLGRFVRLRGLRAGAWFERHAARDVHSGERRVVITGRPGVVGAGERLEAAARALALLHHPHVPRVDARGQSGDTPWLALCCDAEDDLESVWAELAGSGQKLSVAASWGLADCLLDVLAHAHRCRDPRDGGPLCLGSMTWSNVLVSASGKPWLLGFGDELSTSPGVLATSAVRAPEVAVGARPWPGGDLWAALTLFRSLLPLRELPPAVARVMRGQARGEDAAVRARLSALHALLLSEPAQRTHDVSWVRETYRALWAELGIHADLDAFCKLAARAVRARTPGGSLRVAPDASAFRVAGGAIVSLTQRHVARGLLLALIERARSARAAPLTTFELLAAGWPGERMQPEAGAHRVHVALHQLRKLGLAEQLVRTEHGYQLIGALEIAQVDDASE